MANTSRAVQVAPALPIALAVVGLGMVLIAGLAGVVLWLITRRRHAVPVRASADLQAAQGVGEPAEA